MNNLDIIVLQEIIDKIDIAYREVRNPPGNTTEEQYRYSVGAIHTIQSLKDSLVAKVKEILNNNKDCHTESVRDLCDPAYTPKPCRKGKIRAKFNKREVRPSSPDEE